MYFLKSGIKEMIIKRIKEFFYKLALKEKSPRVLAVSVCVGVFISFSPFIFFHTIMIIASAWLFSLNLAAVMSASLFVNNPWTMVPVYSADYVFGEWFLRKIIGLNPLSLNPSWMLPLNNLIFKYTGISGISFWSFMIGGNLLGLIISVILYPVVKSIFKRMSRMIYKSKTDIKWETYEGYREK